MHHQREWSCDPDFLQRLQQRADRLESEADRLRALEASLERIPFRDAGPAAHYALLTIAGLYASRSHRWELAHRLHRQDSRPERLATFLIIKLKHFKNKIAQIAVALRDTQAVENAIRAGKRWGQAVVAVGRSCKEKAQAVATLLSGLKSRPLEYRSQVDEQRHRDLLRTQLQQAIAAEPKPFHVKQQRDMTDLLRLLA